MTDFHLDYETASEADLETVGLANYMEHPSTRILMANYAEGDGRVRRWEPHLNPDPPKELIEALSDPFVTFHGWHVPFEIQATRCLLGIDKPVSEWRCTRIKSRYLSLPGSLDDAGKILGLKESEAKIKDGKRLIQKFCVPETLGGANTLFGLSEPTFRNWATDEQDWENFCVYGGQDVISERVIEKKIKKFPLPEQEWKYWELNEKINFTGWSVNMDIVRGARFIVQKETEILTQKLLELTELSNPNSVQQLLPWLQERNYPFSSLDKSLVARAMAGLELTEDAREALMIRAQTSKSSVKKYTNIADMVSPDGRLRHQYSFMGAARTGRNAAHGVNVGNLAKPDKAVEKRMDLAVELVRKMDYDTIKKEFGKPLDVVASTIRASFQAPEGMKLVVADLASIESVGAHFIARCETGLNVFREGRDSYLDFGVYFYGISYAQLEAEYNAGDKSKRTMCKPATLGSGFGLGPGTEYLDEDGQKQWTGLLAYARAMNVVMTLEEAAKAIEVFRSVYHEIPRTWKDLERAAVRAIRNPGQDFGVGVPHNERETERFESKGRKTNLEPILYFKSHGTKVLEMKLPSGRSLHYIDPRVEEETYVWQGKTLKSNKISYFGKEQNSTSWGRVDTFGGKLFENADQAWARDILMCGLQEADAAGFEVIGSTYDEIITLVPENSDLTLEKLCDCMTKKPSWMPEDIPLKAAGYSGKIYKKD